MAPNPTGFVVTGLCHVDGYRCAVRLAWAHVSRLAEVPWRQGVATGMGSFVLIAPKSVLAALGIFIAVVFILRYVSLGSIVAVASFPLVVWLTRESGATPLSIGFVALASLLIIARHHENIRRLLAGTEPRFQLRRG